MALLIISRADGRIPYAIADFTNGDMAYYFHPWVIQKLALRKELLIDFLVPFQIWCRALYKELTEFKERYKDKQVYKNLSKTLIIIDYRELHNVLREAGKYIGKIERENCKAANYLKRLADLVDNLWHGLQDDFSVNFDQSKHDAWMAAIIKCTKKEELVEVIGGGSDEILDCFKDEEEFGNLKEYLVERFPKK